MTKEEMQKEALRNATQNKSFANYTTIFEGFSEKGISMNDIKPRENVFTYRAWLELGRQVKKGEKGVKVVSFIKGKAKVEKEGGSATKGEGEKKLGGGMFPRTTTVFHITQTEEIKS